MIFDEMRDEMVNEMMVDEMIFDEMVDEMMVDFDGKYLISYHLFNYQSIYIYIVHPSRYQIIQYFNHKPMPSELTKKEMRSYY